ncbi:MAG: ATP-binding protein [bacterium]
MDYRDRFKGIFYGVADIVSLIDTDYTILMVNKAYEKLLTKSAHECIGSKCYAIIRERQDPCEDCPILHTKIENGTAEKLLISIGNDNVYITRHPIYNEQGSLQGVFEIGRIVTREIKMQQEIQHQGRLKIMGELASSIVHEIKNPLAGIGLMAVSVMERLNQKDTIYQDIESILHEVQRLESLLENLMNFAKPSPFALKKTNIHQPIDNTLSLLSRKLSLGMVKVKKVYDLKIPKVMIDPSKMQQVFFNIFLNSLTAMPGGGEITITTTALPEKTGGHEGRRGQTGQVQITIQDNGSGIKEEDLPYVFDPFFTKSPQGTGLGLSIAFRIIELHKGSITIQSQEGQGTTVRISIPVSL